ncbi:DUF4245 domain-containing protein [Corynebacterium sp. ES2794-CONJ1]|uniref:DUF4245 domain-containing protein n=1 Tax=Corynebacterium sp. ES2794-CONJ1 TaxID=2980553 RepID=UPI0021D873BB|nr:DUF4245 domain-containing protein [Corynebacterium sp. ES2794-CONJ1]MCU9519210.1 DUF4245 domain-containing protein [Corynebacterium sp. ES2794-CONJ1]
MAEEKPRIYQSGRDITLSLGAILIVMVVAVAPTGMCSTTVGAPEFGPVKEVDARAFLSLESRAMPYPLRLPQAPQDWVANSARRSSIDGQPATVVGWVVAESGYIKMTQTGLPADIAIAEYDNNPRELVARYQIQGTPVKLYESPDKGVRAVRLIDLGNVRILFSGAANDQEFDTIIAGTILTDPVISEG